MDKKYIFVIVIVMIMAGFINSACKSGTVPAETTPLPTATASGVYVIAEVENRFDRTNVTRAFVTLRSGNYNGSIITGAVAAVNGTSLSYDFVSNSYTAAIPFIAGGNTAAFSLTCTAGSVYGTALIPYAVNITAPSDGTSLPYNMSGFTYITFTTAADPGGFSVVTSKKIMPNLGFGGGSGDCRILFFSPGTTGYGDVTVTVKALNSGTLTGAVAGSNILGSDSGGQVIYNFY
jgi:hypothetical protein